MTKLEIVFSVIGIILSIIGILVGIIGIHSIKISSKNKNNVKNIKNSTVNIDNSIKNGLNSKDLSDLTTILSDTIIDLDNKHSEIQKNNFLEIIRATVLLMQKEGATPTTPADDTWSLKFFEYSSVSSDKNIQNMWAKLLKAKITGKSNISMRTMEVLSNLSPDEAILFDQLTDYGFGDNCIILKQFLTDNNLFDYSSISILIECGLLSTESFLTHHRKIINNIASINNNNLVLVYSPKNNQTEIQFNIYGLTRAGEEIYKSLGKNISDDNFKKIAKWLKNTNSQYNFSLHKINYIHKGNINYDLTDIIDL